MNERKLKEIVAEYKCITDIHPKTKLTTFSDYFLKGFQHAILDVRKGGVWFGPCSAKKPFYEWKCLTEEILREYLDTQKLRYEKRKKLRALKRARQKETEARFGNNPNKRNKESGIKDYKGRPCKVRLSIWRDAMDDCHVSLNLKPIKKIPYDGMYGKVFDADISLEVLADAFTIIELQSMLDYRMDRLKKDMENRP